MPSRLRAVIVALIGLIVAVTLVSAQPAGRPARIGLLSVGADPTRPLAPQWAGFLEVLRERGHVEGQNLVVERRFAAGRSDLVPKFATELVQSGVDVIVATGLRENQAARQATSTIPIVMVIVDDPVAAGFVKSLARSGGNMTGLAFSASGIGGKYVELLKQAVPGAARLAIVASRPQPPELLREMQDAARTVNVTLDGPIMVRGPGDFEPLFARLKREGVGGLVFPNDGVIVLHRERIADLAIKHRLPAIYGQREQAEAGGLMAYGPSFAERFRRAATFVDKILRGAKPAELPVEQPTTFELVLNMKSAKAMGFGFPPSLLARADLVIE